MSYTNLSNFYKSREWEEFSKVIRAQRVNDKGDLVCEHCGKIIVNPYDAICHHVKELTETNIFDPDIAFNPDNIMVVCRRSHNEIHSRFGYNKTSSGGGYVKPYKRVYIVWGSPCAGKDKYVDSVAGVGDLIVSIDRIYDALGVERSQALMPNVMKVYRSLIDDVKTRNGRWSNAYIVRTLPLKIDRDLVLRECGGGELVHIETGPTECFAEARKRGGDWVQWVEQFWGKYQP